MHIIDYISQVVVKLTCSRHDWYGFKIAELALNICLWLTPSGAVCSKNTNRMPQSSKDWFWLFKIAYNFLYHIEKSLLRCCSSQFFQMFFGTECRWMLFFFIFQHGNIFILLYSQNIGPWSYGSWISYLYAISAYHHCKFKSRSGRGVQRYVIKFVSDLRQVSGFLRVLHFPPPIKLTATI